MKKLKNSAALLIKESKQEFLETKTLLKLIWKAKRKKLTNEEIKIIEGQSIDILRLIILTGLFIIPFSGVLIILLIKGGKKMGIQVLPSSFNKI